MGTWDCITLGESRIRLFERCARLAAISEESGKITRSFLSPSMQQVNTLVAGWMEKAGMRTELDSVGNLIGTYPCRQDTAPILVLGSHLDTVRDAGPYDGVLGVLLALAVVEELEGAPLPFELEIIAFSDEEGLRFGAPFLGSKGLIGEIEPTLMERKDDAGITMAEAIRSWGGDPEKISSRYQGRQVLGYVEAHIEQGPWLEHRGLSLGIVEAISSSRWYRLRLHGNAGHAGTTPMELRKDPLPAAAEIVLAAERLAREEDDLVATVGHLKASPGASNVIPGMVDLSLDMRHPNSQRLEELVCTLLAFCQDLAQERGLRFEVELLNRQDGVEADPWLSDRLREAVTKTGNLAGQLVIGAGHDALIMSRIAPIAMLLLRSPGGISHHPDESVLPSDVEAALVALHALVRGLEDFLPRQDWDSAPTLEKQGKASHPADQLLKE